MGSSANTVALLIVAVLRAVVLWVQHRYVRSVERAAEDRLTDASEV